MAYPLPAFDRLDAVAASCVLAFDALEPRILYLGPRLPDGIDLAQVAAVLARAVTPNRLADEPAIALTPTMATGFAGPPGLAGHRDGRDWAAAPELAEVLRPDAATVRLVSHDPRLALTLVQELRLDPVTGVLEAWAEITNTGNAPFQLDRLAAPVLPLPAQFERLVTVTGRWALEFGLEERPFGVGAHVRENRRGRSSHDAFPGLVLMAPGTGQQTGEAFAAHLAASGNHRLHAERFADGRGLLMMEELFVPGELRLAPGGCYRTPTLHAAWTANGLQGLSAALQAHVRRRVLPPTVAARPRPVHYNSWEAIYFDHDEAVLRDLATRAARLGVERFVLDDGWFGGRRSDRAGLGDWTVSADVYPHGLGPLIDHVRDLGMEFGLWVEPEMANPDSDLLRAHPDWVLSLPGLPQREMRHQLVLDLTRAEVADHLFARLDTLLRENAIAYLKWDMNRDVSHPGTADGRPVAQAQTAAVHALIDRLRSAHPAVEIESCASGGGRADYAMLQRTERVWTSDSNDALDRIAIQRGASLFLPPEVMGSHVGPRHGHITGRVLPMALRAGVALFGHMGLEMDLRELSDDEAAMLSAAIALHKDLRPLLHGGVPLRLDLPAPHVGWGVAAPDHGRAIFALAVTATPPLTQPPPVRLPGLDRGARYRLRRLWPVVDPRDWPAHLAGMTLPGAVLADVGVMLPPLPPQALVILEAERVQDGVLP